MEQNMALLTYRCRGTASYRAPELVLKPGERRYFSQAVDIWALGCIFFEIVYRVKAFVFEVQVNEFCVSNRTSLHFPNDSMGEREGLISKSAQEYFRIVIMQMLEIIPSRRPLVVTILTALGDLKLSDFVS